MKVRSTLPIYFCVCLFALLCYKFVIVILKTTVRALSISNKQTAYTPKSFQRQKFGGDSLHSWTESLCGWTLNEEDLGDAPFHDEHLCIS